MSFTRSLSLSVLALSLAALPAVAAQPHEAVPSGGGHSAGDALVAASSATATSDPVAATKAGNALAARFAGLPYLVIDGRPDLDLTLEALLALLAVGGHDAQVEQTVSWLESADARPSFTGDWGTLAVGVMAAGGDPGYALGGIDLVERVELALEDGVAGGPQDVELQSSFMLALVRAGRPVPQEAVDTLIGMEYSIGDPGRARKLEVLAALDTPLAVKESALTSRDALILAQRPDGHWGDNDDVYDVLETGLVAPALAQVNADTASALAYLRSRQRADGGFVGGFPEFDIRLTAHAAMAFSGKSPATAGLLPVGARDYRPHPVLTRLAGADRYQAGRVVARAWKPNPGVAVVASGTSFADALSAGALGVPVLLTRPGSLPEETSEALSDLNPTLVLVVGGSESVSDAVVRQVEGTLLDAQVYRIEGANRYEVSANVATLFPDGTTRAFVATGGNWPDGLAGGARAGIDDAPLLLTKPTDVPSAVMRELRRLDPDEIVVIGGTASVGADAVAELKTVAPVRRIGGATRYEVAAHLAAEFPDSPDGITFLATGDNWPDALTGSALAGSPQFHAPVLLVHGDEVPPATQAAMEARGTGKAIVLGGQATISPAAMRALHLLQTAV